MYELGVRKLLLQSQAGATNTESIYFECILNLMWNDLFVDFNSDGSE